MRSEALCEGSLFDNIVYMRYVYELKLADESYYIGSTPRLEERLKDHNKGKCLSTKSKRPIQLHWYCRFLDDKKALEFEQYLKGGSGTAFRHKHLE